MALLTTNEVSPGRKRCDFLHVLERIFKPLHGVKPYRVFVDCSMHISPKSRKRKRDLQKVYSSWSGGLPSGPACTSDFFVPVSM